MALFVQETPVVKQMGAKTGARNLLQKLFRDNCVGINVGGIQWDNQAGMLGKFLCHGSFLI